MIDPERNYTPTDAAQLLGVHPVTLRRWIKSGELPGRKLPNLRYAVKGKDLIEFLNRRGVSLESLKEEQ